MFHAVVGDGVRALIVIRPAVTGRFLCLCFGRRLGIGLRELGFVLVAVRELREFPFFFEAIAAKILTLIHHRDTEAHSIEGSRFEIADGHSKGYPA
jgi:hypothetical protein